MREEKSVKINVDDVSKLSFWVSATWRQTKFVKMLLQCGISHVCKGAKMDFGNAAAVVLACKQKL